MNLYQDYFNTVNHNNHGYRWNPWTLMFPSWLATTLFFRCWPILSFPMCHFLCYLPDAANKARRWRFDLGKIGHLWMWRVSGISVMPATTLPKCLRHHFLVLMGFPEVKPKSWNEREDITVLETLICWLWDIVLWHISSQMHCFPELCHSKSV